MREVGQGRIQDNERVSMLFSVHVHQIASSLFGTMGYIPRTRTPSTDILAIVLFGWVMKCLFGMERGVKREV